MNIRETLFSPIIQNNPIALQILGICYGLFIVFHLYDSKFHPFEYSYHCSNDDHCFAGNRR